MIGRSMSKKNIRRQKQKKELTRHESVAQREFSEESFSPEVEKRYKLILRIMSWIVGSSIVSVIFLFYFNSPAIDKLSQVIFYIGILTLVLFIVIEIVGSQLKRFISKMIKEQPDAKSITS